MKKFSPRFAIYQVLVAAVVLVFIAFMILSSFADDNGNLPEVSYGYALGGYLVGLVLATIYSYFYHNTSGYEFNEKEVVCKKGVIFKKKSIVELSKIHAVNIKQTLVQRILGISGLMIDSGSTNTAHTAEIVIYDDVKVINNLYNKLQNKEILENKVESDNLYSFTSKLKIIYTALNSIFSLILLVFGTLFVAFILYLLKPMVEDQVITLAECFLYPLLIFGFIFVITALTNVGKAFINYYGFEIKNLNENIEINYGLFVKVHNSFNVNKVRAVKITVVWKSAVLSSGFHVKSPVQGINRVSFLGPFEEAF